MLKSLVPRGIKKTLRGFVKNSFGLAEPWEPGAAYFERKKSTEESIPKYELAQRHINHLRVVLDRESLLRQLPSNGVVAEIGVNRGEFSEWILRINTPSRLHLIDAWGDPTGRYHDALKEEVQRKFQKEIDAGRVEINVGFSTDVLKTYRDHYFDWVYVDTDHTYGTTAAELAILKTKVKPGGIIAGHDYTLGNWVTDFRYGVIEAVHELCVKEDWELIYLTNETHQCRNFAIRKL